MLFLALVVPSGINLRSKAVRSGCTISHSYSRPNIPPVCRQLYDPAHTGNVSGCTIIPECGPVAVRPGHAPALADAPCPPPPPRNGRRPALPPPPPLWEGKKEGGSRERERGGLIMRPGLAHLQCSQTIALPVIIALAKTTPVWQLPRE